MTTTTFDLTTIVEAIEADDADAQVANYAADAVVQTFNRDHGPADPVVLRGRDAIATVLHDVASRGLEHRVDRAVTDGNAGAIQVTCRYPDGTGVVCSSTFDLEGGLIVRETRFEVWD